MVKKFRRYVYSFWRDPRTWRTHRRTPGDGIYRAYAWHRAVKIRGERTVHQPCTPETWSWTPFSPQCKFTKQLSTVTRLNIHRLKSRINSPLEHWTVCCIVKVKVQVMWIYIAPSRETSTALRLGSHSFTCKLHHVCLYLVSVYQMALPLTCDSVRIIAAYYSSIDPERMKRHTNPQYTSY